MNYKMNAKHLNNNNNQQQAPRLSKLMAINSIHHKPLVKSLKASSYRFKDDDLENKHESIRNHSSSSKTNLLNGRKRTRQTLNEKTNENNTNSSGSQINHGFVSRSKLSQSFHMANVSNKKLKTSKSLIIDNLDETSNNSSCSSKFSVNSSISSSAGEQLKLLTKITNSSMKNFGNNVMKSIATKQQTNNKSNRSAINDSINISNTTLNQADSSIIKNSTFVDSNNHNINSTSQLLPKKSPSPVKKEPIVLVPKWRVNNIKGSYKLEGTENTSDELYAKRHQKYENEEKQIKRWDMRRQREEMERKKLLNKSRQPFLVPQASPQPEKPSQCNLNLPIYYKPCDPKDFKDIEYLQLIDEEEIKNLKNDLENESQTKKVIKKKGRPFKRTVSDHSPQNINQTNMSVYDDLDLDFTSGSSPTMLTSSTRLTANQKARKRLLTDSTMSKSNEKNNVNNKRRRLN